MRKLIASINISLDGFMAGTNGDLNWHFPHWNSEMSAYAIYQLSSIDTVLLGRVTYEGMYKYWSTRPTDEFGYKMNNYAKIVLSRTLSNPPWKNSFLIKDNVADKLADLKNDKGKDIIVYGSCSVVNMLNTQNIIDEYKIWVHPVIIGKGIPLFKDISNTINLKLIKPKIFNSGVIVLHYVRNNTDNKNPASVEDTVSRYVNCM